MQDGCRTAEFFRGDSNEKPGSACSPCKAGNPGAWHWNCCLILSFKKLRRRTQVSGLRRFRGGEKAYRITIHRHQCYADRCRPLRRAGRGPSCAGCPVSGTSIRKDMAEAIARTTPVRKVRYMTLCSAISHCTSEQSQVEFNNGHGENRL